MDEVIAGDMSPEMIRRFLDGPYLARLATADLQTAQPHVVPVWYLWDGESVWISSFRSTRKVRELQANSACSIVIDDAESGVEFQSVLFEGQAELVSGPVDFVQRQTERIYTRYLGEEGVKAPDPQSWIQSPENLLIRLRPEKTRAWFSARKGTGAAG